MRNNHLYKNTSKRRKAKKLQPKTVDRIIYAVVILEPVFVLPQVVKIFYEKQASGVALSTWIGFQVMTTVWLWYAFEHKQKVILLSNSLFWVVQLGVIVGGLMYGARW